MNFRILNASIINLLGAAQGSDWRTIGYQKQAQGADKIKNGNRTVQVFYSGGIYPKSAGSLNGYTMHDMTFSLDLTVAKACTGDLATLDNPGSTALQLQTALANLKIAVHGADESLNELKELIYQEIMKGTNQNLGLSVPVANRWVDEFNKDPLQTRGELAVLTGSMKLTARMDEQMIGEVGVPLMVFDTNIEQDGDVIGRAGIYQEHDIVVEDTTGDIVLDPVSGNYLEAA